MLLKVFMFSVCLWRSIIVEESDLNRFATNRHEQYFSARLFTLCKGSHTLNACGLYAFIT